MVVQEQVRQQGLHATRQLQRRRGMGMDDVHVSKQSDLQSLHGALEILECVESVTDHTSQMDDDRPMSRCLWFATSMQRDANARAMLSVNNKNSRESSL
jgi:hypothetical protein